MKTKKALKNMYIWTAISPCISFFLKCVAIGFTSSLVCKNMERRKINRLDLFLVRNKTKKDLDKLATGGNRRIRDFFVEPTEGLYSISQVGHLLDF